MANFFNTANVGIALGEIHLAYVAPHESHNFASIAP